MKRRGRRSALEVYQGHFGPNMTPMVDVVMVILVFFMASAVVLGPDWFIRAALPVRSAAAGTTRDGLVRLELSLEWTDGTTRIRGVYSGDGRRELSLPPAPDGLPLDELRAWMGSLVRAAGPRRLLVAIAPSRQVPYQDVVTAHEACLAAGIERIGIAPAGVEPP